MFKQPDVSYKTIIRRIICTPPKNLSLRNSCLRRRRPPTETRVHIDSPSAPARHTTRVVTQRINVQDHHHTRKVLWVIAHATVASTTSFRSLHVMPIY
ncbi:unnamed protein product [Peniophora sp. CBMAI 1063]|nr:unnamed protein product [Peniophora sp. CBMAI 1063]